MLLCGCLLRSSRHVSILPARKLFLTRPIQVLKVSPKCLLKPFIVGSVYTLSLSPLLKIKQLNCKQKGVLPARAKELSKRYANRKEPQFTWADLYSIVRPFWIWILGAVATALLVAAINIRIPLYLGELVNSIAKLHGKQTVLDSLRPIALKLIVAYAAQSVLTFLRITFLSVLGERVASRMRLRLFTAFMAQDMSFFDAERTSEMSARLNNDVHEFKSAFKHFVGQGLRTLAEAGGAMVSLYYISSSMTLITMSSLPLLIVCGSVMGHCLRLISRRAQAQTATAAGVADEALVNIRTVRAFAMEYSEALQYNSETEKAALQHEYLGAGIGLFQALMHLTMNGLVLGVLYGGAHLMNTNQLQPGDLMSYLVTSQSIMKALSQFSLLFGDAVKGHTAAARVFEFIHSRPRLRLFGGVKIPYHSLVGDIRFEDVSFSYPVRPEHLVFDHMNLHVAPGQVLALVGASGAGKSTIASLLEQFYVPDEGRVTIDGYDVTQIDPNWLRGQAIGFIAQEPILFAASIRENIRYGKPDASDAEIEKAARLANAHEFIESLPQGYGTCVGERGATLSGGQKQRVAIARAMLKNPPILILDEATSALDAQSERMVRDALDKAMRGRTVIIIAHRLSTVQNAHNIAVISNKHVAEMGTHDKLMKEKGIYYSLVKAQADIE